MTSSVNSLESLIDQMILQKRKLEEEDLNRSVSPDQYSTMDKNKLGSKRFVIRQPEEMKEWRQEMKGLFSQYLAIKIPEEEDPKGEPLGELKKKSSFSCTESPSISSDIDVFEIRFKMKIGRFSSWYRLSRRFDSLILLQKRGIKKMEPLSQKERLFFQESFFSRLFQGNHLEYIKHHGQIEKMPDSFWSGWKIQMKVVAGLLSYLPQTAQQIISNAGNRFFPVTLAWSQYQEVLHPAIQEAALQILNMPAEPQPNVVEICGGEGDLAVGIAEKYQRPMNYYLLEYNDLSLQRAVNLAASKNENLGRIIPIKTDVANPNDYFVDKEKKVPMQKETIDLIIGCGALTERVLESREKALAAARKCHELLNQNGKMILTGLSSSFLDSEDFSALGFRVLNRSFAGKIKPFYSDVNPQPCALRVWNKQFYILEKI